MQVREEASYSTAQIEALLNQLTKISDRAEFLSQHAAHVGVLCKSEQGEAFLRTLVNSLTQSWNESFEDESHFKKTISHAKKIVPLDTIHVGIERGYHSIHDRHGKFRMMVLHLTPLILFLKKNKHSLNFEAKQIFIILDEMNNQQTKLKKDYFFSTCISKESFHENRASFAILLRHFSLFKERELFMTALGLIKRKRHAVQFIMALEKHRESFSQKKIAEKPGYSAEELHAILGKITDLSKRENFLSRNMLNVERLYKQENGKAFYLSLLPRLIKCEYPDVQKKISPSSPFLCVYQKLNALDKITQTSTMDMRLVCKFIIKNKSLFNSDADGLFETLVHLARIKREHFGSENRFSRHIEDKSAIIILNAHLHLIDRIDVLKRALEFLKWEDKAPLIQSLRHLIQDPDVLIEMLSDIPDANRTKFIRKQERHLRRAASLVASAPTLFAEGSQESMKIKEVSVDETSTDVSEVQESRGLIKKP